MNRHKVLELAREVFSSPPITHIGTEKLVAFAALIEREVRGDEVAVPRMLVDALELVLQCYRDEKGFISSGQNNHATTKANLALAAAKEAGI